jgi:3-phenylpropionate/trans-cinnamate dioxygenase ferredoxin subunit
VTPERFGPSPLERPAAPAGFEPVARDSSLPDGTILAVRAPDGEDVCLLRAGGNVFALRDRCSHQAFPLSQGELCGNDTVECVWHGARFDIRTGKAMRGPATGSVPTYEVLEVDGWICVGPRRG